MKKPTLTVFRRALHYLSGEWILVDWDIPNGGAVVLIRSLFSGTVLSKILPSMNLFAP